MTKYILLLSFLVQACTSGPSPDEARYIAIEHTNVVDVINGQLVPDQTVVIKDSLIHYIGDNWQGSGHHVEIIDGHGKYLMPGLWDMHVHVCWEQSNDSLVFPALLANGITGFRDMGGDLGIQDIFKSRVEANPAVGPEIFGAGPIIDGNPPMMVDFSIAVDDKIDIPHLLDSLVANGADFIKTYSLLRETELAKISDYAHTHLIPFAGHLSEYVEPEVAIDLGQKSVEHLNRLEEIWSENEARIGQIAEQMVEKQTWLCPTLIVYYLKAHLRDSSIIHPEYEANIHPLLKQEWQTSRENRLNRYDSVAWINQLALFERQKALVAFMHDKGVKLLSGSDFAGMPYVYPGIGLHHELFLLHESGLSNAEVLATATINPATYLSIQDKYGSVTVGKYADLILLDGNPLDDLENLGVIHILFRKGRKINR
ncbi:MAG: amidohydrolase [Saprospiraceae bacterium]|nr:MAG: amidohydrolase [Saprospiraceae bacterium]